jgi:CubicO group peptidase (beta-lactamase class C family)
MRHNLAFLLLFFPFVLSAQFSVSDSLFVDSLMEATYADSEPGAVILISIDGNPVFRRAYGMANLEMDVPLSPDHVFAIGSISKQFTAVALLQLAEDGKLLLDDPVTKYLPDYNTHGELITIRHLLNHTSGITSFTELDTFAQIVNKDLGKQETLNLFMDEPLLFEPGTDWSYSNSGYSVAGLIAEKVSGMSLEAYLKLFVFRRLAMKQSGMGSNDRSIPGFVTGYTANNNGYYPAREFSWTWPFAAGAVVSSVDDLMKWDHALYSDKLLGEAMRKDAFTGSLLADGTPTHYGLGWGVSTYKDYTFIRHGGAINGFLSDAIRIPELKMYMVVLSNNTIKRPGAIIDKTLNKILDLQIEPLETLDEQIDLTEYTGVYEETRRGGRLVSNMGDEAYYRIITLEDSTLYTQKKGGTKIPFQRVGKDEFYTSDPYTRFHFRRNAEGDIIYLEREFLPTAFGPTDISYRTDIPIPEEREAIDIDESILQRYTGNYDMGNGLTMVISVQDGRIFAQVEGQTRIEIFPASETELFYKAIDADIVFLWNGKRCTGFEFDQGYKLKGRKIE